MASRLFIYELPYAVRKKLCLILDASGKWEQLGGQYMGFEYTYLQCLHRKDSPTDELLTSWGNQNHTVVDLFVSLSKMQHYRAMTLLKDLVPEQFHHLLRDGEEVMSRPPLNKGLLDQGYSNGTDHRQHGINGVAEGPAAAVRPLSVAASPETFEDNKDLGLDMHNLNLAGQKTENKTREKNVNEIKVQNVPDNRRNQNVDPNSNVQNNNYCNSPPQNASLSPQIESSAQRPGHERKLSNVSITSSAAEACTPLIEYGELETATNGWDQSYILGKGGFGTVYKGTWKNTLVAIKKLDHQKDEQMQSQKESMSQMNQSLNELKFLNSHRHDNILSLYGYSVTDTASCLVYQYMANGSLDDRLHCRQNTEPLKWGQRLNIMTGTARGIQFLHSLGKTPLVHGDIKSANILLDHNFEPRLGDFGLAREGPMQHYTYVKVDHVHGTKPYLPDEFLRNKQFSFRVDTYSFGVVLFEVATGRRAYDNSKKEFLKDFIVSKASGDLSRLADPKAGRDLCASAAGLLTLGLNCVVTKPKERPNMKSVLRDLDTLYNSYKDAERATSLGRQRSLTPTTPLEMQVVYDELRNHSPHLPVQGSPQTMSMPFHFQDTPQLVFLPAPQLQGSFQQPFQFPPVLSHEAQHFAKGIGTVHVVPGHQIGRPQPIIIHHPPATPPVRRPSTPKVTVQPPTTSHAGLYTPSQAGENRSPSPPLDSSNLPFVTLLGNKPESDLEHQQSPVLSTGSSVQDSLDSIPTQSMTQADVSRDISPARVESEFIVSLPNEGRSTYLPLLPELLSKPAVI